MDRQNTVPGSSKPQPPFHNWSVQLHDPRFGYAWYVEPGVFVSQLDVTSGDEQTACGIHDAIDRVLLAKAQRLREVGGLFVLHDFRAMRSYTSKGRLVFLERMRSRAKGYSRGAAVITGMNPLLRMAVQTGNLVYSLILGSSVRIVEDPAPLLRELGVQSPSSQSVFP